MSENEEISQIIDRISNNTANDEEIGAYNAWCAAQQQHNNTGNFKSTQLKLLYKINQGIDQSERSPVFSFPRVAAAASVALFIIAGVLFIVNKTPSVNIATSTSQSQDIGPGTNKAILTLGDGKQVALAGLKNGVLAKQGKTLLTKATAGHLIYSAGLAGNSTIVYNTVTTPRGGQYRLTLADGTNVWLNAASSIKYPTNFVKKERLVEITGEAYFEVAHNKLKPFRVLSAGQVVEVLGTHFNINSYADEGVTNTTLLQGSISITNRANNRSDLLKPGQQALLKGTNTTIASADTEEATAWKNGYFRFNDERLPGIMRKIARWYNVDVEYKGAVSPELYNGKISRFKNINQVLEILTDTKTVHFKIEGRRITVMN